MAPSGKEVVCDGDVCRLVDAPASKTAPSPAASGSALEKLFGPTLIKNDGSEVPTSSFAGPKQVLGVYFSAHWCPPCRGFTPEFAEIYTKFKASHKRAADFEVVFVSSDRDEASFKEYHSEMPWLALPFEHRDLKQKLGQKLKVQGIPSLVILDASNGKVITENGRDAVLEDPEGEGFPWRPRTFHDIIDGPLVDKEGNSCEAKEALAGKVTLVYFSAHWCPPCRGFTPELGKAYEGLKAAGKEVELVFASSDRSEEQWKEYCNEMPAWKLLPWDDKKRKDALSNLFDVQGIPTLVVVGPDGEAITSNGRSAVAHDPEGADFPWHPKPVQQLDPMTVDEVNGGAVLIYLTHTCPAEAHGDDKALEAHCCPALLGPAARDKADAKAKEDKGEDGGEFDGKLTFMYGSAKDELVTRVITFAGVDAPAEGSDAMFILDIPNQAVFMPLEELPAGTRADEEAVTKLAADYRAGKLVKEPIGRNRQDEHGDEDDEDDEDDEGEESEDGTDGEEGEGEGESEGAGTPAPQ